MEELQLPIVMSRAPKGRMQLHRLKALHQFTCCRCRQKKRSLLVALVDNDVARPICNGCYGNLSAAPAEMETVGELVPVEIPPKLVPPPPPKKPKAALETATKSTQLAQQQPQKQPKKEKLTKAEKRAQRQAEQRARRELALLRNADDLFSFFRRAGIEARSRHGEVIVNGKKVIALSALWGLGRHAYNDVRDQIAAVACSREFVEAMKRNARGVGEHLRAYYDRDAHGFELRDGDEAIALIRAGGAHIYGGATVEGNFLVDGPHWGLLRAKIVEDKVLRPRAATPAPAEKPHPAPKHSVTPPRRRILVDEVPVGVSPELAEVVVEASRKIREERRHAFDRPITLEYELGSFILSPIVGTPEFLRVPFVFLRDRKRVEGDILLSSNRDPLPVHIDEEADLMLESVWAGALLALADATCFELPSSTERREPVVSRPSPSKEGSRSGGSGYRRMRSSPRSEIWPSHLRPVGAWARYSGAFVSGHRRHLHDGWSASADAENARRVGIVLGPGETWVKPHARGLPYQLEIRFKWRAAEPLLTEHRVHGQQPEWAPATSSRRSSSR
jgi:hypothetical protein